jgi:SAM-dependent methyltransferase
MAETPDERALRVWTETAPYWAKHRDFVDALLGPVTPALVDEAGIAAGQSVLDVAGGTGEPSLTIARLAGPSGRVVCTDAVEGMVAAARGEARRLGLANVVFARCVAEALPFGADAFDAVVCRFGVMFFPDPEAGVGEMLRVTRPGGPVALAVWRARELNPLSRVVGDTIARFLELPPSSADAFRFAVEGSLAAVLAACGAEDVRARPVDFRHRAPLGFDEVWAIRVEMSEALRSALAPLAPDQARVVAEEVRGATAEYFAGGSMDFPASALVVSGRKPARRTFASSRRDFPSPGVR